MVNYKDNKKLFNKIQENKIIKLYSKDISIIKIAKMFNCSITPIRKILNNNNNIPKNNKAKIHSISKRKYIINDNFFENINSEEKAYILGFIYADGNLHKNEFAISLELAKKDSKTLNKIKNLFEYIIENLDT